MMFSDCQDILDQSKIKLVYQNMDQPLSHYWIASSHNTYLLGNQARNFFIPGWKTLNQKQNFQDISSRSAHWTTNFTNPKFQFPQFKNRVLGWFECMWNQIFGVAVFHQKSKIYNVWSMWGLCLVPERSFLRDLRPWSFRHQTKASHASNIINFWFLMKNRYPKKSAPHTFKLA